MQSFSLFFLPFAFFLLLLEVIEDANGGHSLVSSQKMRKSMTMSRKSGHFKATPDDGRKRDDYIEHIMTPYGTPEPFSRVVRMGFNTKTNSKWLVSRDPSMQAILNFVQYKLGHNHEKLVKLQNGEKEEEKFPLRGCHLSFHFDPRTINPKVFRFDVGTRVSEESIEHLELFEERETGRKMIIDKKKEWGGRRKAESGENKASKSKGKSEENVKESEEMEKIEEEKEEGKDGIEKVEKEGEAKVGELAEGQKEKPEYQINKDEDEPDDDDEDDEDEEPTIPLNTYASIGAIQYGKKAFGEEAELDMTNIPELNVIRDGRLIERVKKFFADIIDACDGKLDGAVEQQLSEDTPIFVQEKDKFDLDGFLKQVKADGGKMKSQDDVNMYMEDLNAIMKKMIASVQAASDYERAEIKALAEEKKRDFEESTKLDHGQLKRLKAEKHKPYEFLKTVRFAINARPPFREFKKLTFREYQELEALSDKSGFGKLKQTLNWLKIGGKLDENYANALLVAAEHSLEAFDSEVAKNEYQILLDKEDVEDLKEAANSPTLKQLLVTPLNEILDREECRQLMEYATSKKLMEFHRVVARVKGKLKEEQFKRLVNTDGDAKKLKTLIEGSMGSVHRGIADSLIYGKKQWDEKVDNWLFQTAKSLGKNIGEKAVWLFKTVFRIKSKEITSSEKEKVEKKEAEKLKFLLQERRWAIYNAVMTIRQYQKCHELSEPIRYAIYAEKKEEIDEESRERREQNQAVAEGAVISFDMASENEQVKMRKELATMDLRGRLGAQAMNAVLNTKRFPEGHSTALAMSVLGSGSIGIILDVALIPLFLLGATHLLGPIPHLGVALVLLIKYVIKPMLESATPLVAETFDSAIIKQYLESLKGKKFWRGLKHFKKTLVEAFESGKIAAIGSVFYNISMLASFPGSLPLQLFLNGIATIASAAMVPIELMKTRDEIIKALHYKMENKFFPKPTDKEQDEMAKEMLQNHATWWKRFFVTKPLHKRMRDEEKRNWAYTNWLEKITWRTMEVEQSSRLAINSMGIGPIISSIVFLAMQYFQEATKAPETLVNAVSVMFNSPTEMISMTGAIWGANNIGFERFPWLLSTDEQKNGLIMGAIFTKSRNQMETGNFENIDDAQMHRIYNPYMAWTMPMGRFFVRSGIALKTAWDKFSNRHEYWRDEKNTKTGNRGWNPEKLIVENYRQNVVYLITFPRTSFTPTLSPKSMALEYWLKMHIDKIDYYRVSDGFFVPELFSNTIPYVEYNGKKLRGTTQQIIEALAKNMPHLDRKNEAHFSGVTEHLLARLEVALVADRHKGGMDFLFEDKALVATMLSTMSQLFPKLVEYELDYIDSWDTLPGQLKGAFNKMGTKIEPRIAELKEELKKIRVAQHRNESKQTVFDLKQTMEEVVKILNENMEKAAGSSNHKFYLSDKPSYLEGFLLGLLTQFFETPLSTKALNDYFKEHKKSKSVLYRYYNQRKEEMADEKADSWGKQSDEEALPLNFDLIPVEKLEKTGDDQMEKEKQIEEENKKRKYNSYTEKYEGQFIFKFVRTAPGITLSPQKQLPFKALSGLDKISGERPVPVGWIKADMRATKVNHNLVGPLWKVQKEWGEEEFAAELERRVAKEKRERFGRHVHEMILALSSAEGEGQEEKEEEETGRNLTPMLAAVVDRLLDVIWDWAKPMQLESMSNVPYIDHLDKAEQQLGEKIAKIVNEYVERKAANSGDIEIEADSHVYGEFVDLDKSREVFDKLSRTAVHEQVDAFYDEELKKQMLDLIEHGKTLSCAIEEHEPGFIERIKSTFGILNQPKKKLILKKVEAKKAEAIEKIKRVIAQMKAPTIKELLRRIRYIFDQEAGVHLLDAVEFMAKIGVVKNKEGKDIPIKEHVEETINEMLHKEGMELEPAIDKCIENFFKRQSDATEYISKNNARIGTDKSRLGTQDRLFRLFDRYIDMKSILSKNCPKYLEMDLFERIEPDVNEGEIGPDGKETAVEASSSLSKVPEVVRKETLKMRDILNRVDDRSWRSKFQQKRNELKDVLKELEKRRKKKLDQVVSIYTFNDRTRGLVKAKVDASDLSAERDRLEARLAEEGADEFRISIANSLLLAEQASQHDGKLKKHFVKFRKEVAARMRAIVRLQEECIQNLHLTLANPDMEKRKCEGILKSVEGKYNELRNAIDAQMHTNAFQKEPVKQEIGNKITEIEKIREEIGQLYAKYPKTAKKLIVEGIKGIKAEEIREKATLEKFKIFSFKWEKHMAKQEAALKKQRLDQLLTQIEEDKDLLLKSPEIGLKEAKAKITDLNGNEVQKLEGNEEWKDRLANWGNVPEKSKMAEMLAKMESITNVGYREVLQKEMGQMYKKEVEKRRMELIRNTKYPIAKGILHLAAAYLCDGDGCKNHHIKMAEDKTTGLGKVMVDSNAHVKLLPAVQKLVFYTIGDFNENCVIREEILEQFGLPLEKEVMHAYGERPFWDTEDYRAAEVEKAKKEAEEKEAKKLAENKGKSPMLKSNVPLRDSIFQHQHPKSK